MKSDAASTEFDRCTIHWAQYCPTGPVPQGASFPSLCLPEFLPGLEMPELESETTACALALKCRPLPPQ